MHRVHQEDRIKVFKERPDVTLHEGNFPIWRADRIEYKRIIADQDSYGLLLLAKKVATSSASVDAQLNFQVRQGLGIGKKEEFFPFIKKYEDATEAVTTASIELLERAIITQLQTALDDYTRFHHNFDDCLPYEEEVVINMAWPSYQTIKEKIIRNYGQLATQAKRHFINQSAENIWVN
ncbi:hypothetical protein B484DRAFT_466320 [Ochromonadaceae sp. CCMP2298]|nr:hypothetical protein B484DRAFT_466320 [Ochromonadaceae sp. CCMP2298]